MLEAAHVITEILTEVIIAPDATEEAIAIISKRKNLRLLLAGQPARSTQRGPDCQNRRRRLCWCRAVTTPWSMTSR